MITHSINKYRNSWEITTSPVSYGKFSNYGTTYPYNSKVEYARWLGNLSMQTGDYLIKGAVLILPVHKEQLYRVLQMQEVHYMLKFDGARPLAIEVVDCIGNREWVCPWSYRKIYDVKDEDKFEMPTP